MTQTDPVPRETAGHPAGPWRGLGAWNLYFIIKLMLFWQGAIAFDALANLVFATFLLMPLPPRWLHRLRHLIAVPIGTVLLYHDSWLPPFQRLLAQSSQVTALSPGYLLELAERLIDWQWLGIVFVLSVGYAFIAPWVRVGVPVVAGLIWLNVAPLLSLSPLPAPPPTTAAMPVSSGEETDAPVSPPEAVGEARLDRQLAAFYAHEASRQVEFAARPSEAPPFDLLIINVCSLSWDDLAFVGLTDHPLLDYLDVVFDNFNSATSYSGPAGIRLLRASCGQRPHDALYTPAPAQCHLFDNLADLGFAPQLALNHNGHFDNYLDELQHEGGLDVSPMSLEGLNPVMTAFDDSPIYADAELLARWQATDAPDSASATFYNSVSLHDGNRYVSPPGSADYTSRLTTLFDGLLAFLQRLDSAGRRVAVLIVPEHAAALRGDRMQFSGMREIPAPAITHVPVGLKLTGLPQPRTGEPLHVHEPTSYLAISTLISRLVASDPFTTPSIAWQTLLADLPVTDAISENEAVVVMPHQGTPYVQFQGDGWIPLP